MRILNRDFYTRDTITVAMELLGKVLVHQTDAYTVAGRIVEVEAYLGPEDKAAHSYGEKATPRVEAMYNQGGCSYIFNIYGMYQCFNIVTEKQGVPQAVLIRALEPIDNTDFMSEMRFGKPYSALNSVQIKNLTSGPGKLCIAMGLSMKQNKLDMCRKNGIDDIYVYDDGYCGFEIAASPRINIDYAEEYVHKPWRFYIKGSNHVSKK